LALENLRWGRRVKMVLGDLLGNYLVEDAMVNNYRFNPFNITSSLTWTAFSAVEDAMVNNYRFNPFNITSSLTWTAFSAAAGAGATIIGGLSHDYHFGAIGAASATAGTLLGINLRLCMDTVRDMDRVEESGLKRIKNA
jgi:hypothetical protein